MSTTPLPPPPTNVLPEHVSPHTPCASALRDLRKIMVGDLGLKNHHRGSYLLSRSLASPRRTDAGLVAVVEDENKNLIEMSLHHQAEEDERAGEDFLGIGKVLIVKEPYIVKIIDDSDEERLAIRVEHASDVIFLPEWDERIPNFWQKYIVPDLIPVSMWKAQGNFHFGKARYFSAIECYTKALEGCPTAEEAQILRLNRALAFIKSKHFDGALSDLDSASKIQKPNEKALFRNASALYGLERYRDCCETLKTLCLEYPKNGEARAELTRAINRLAEQKYGRYSFSQLYKKVSIDGPRLLDQATFIGPICVKAAGFRGRGLFTTKPVKTGELLLCEKAFAYAPKTQVDVAISILSPGYGIATEEKLTTVVVQKLYRNPSLIPAITDLHHGSYKPVDVAEVDGTPIIDTFLVKRIINLNGFDCPLSDRESYMTNPLDGMDLVKKPDEMMSQGCGLWHMASYMNHCCIRNVGRAIIGDMMIVSATKDLPADTELTTWYAIPSADNHTELQTTLDGWGFNCDCEMCKDHQVTKESVLSKRKSLRADCQECAKDFEEMNVAKMESLFRALEDTHSRPASEVPRLSVYDVALILARLYMRKTDAYETINWSLKVLSSLGFFIEGGNMPRIANPPEPLVVRQWGLGVGVCIECWLMLAIAYFHVAPDLESQAWECARLSYKICTG
ncbi:hypothetical protein LTR84_003502 [Exophiala bonariae]|uniref:SET domain-containing protein n=1 Tax=Exophiala bonariae TaxID=1690606 RepID=A0AAV9N7G8_9EURO|nr:hypothetical protein LTR84_003502 [Exophiala bonariae]